MMKKIKSNPWMRSKALYVIPVAALALSAFATPKFVAPIEETVTKLEGKVTNKQENYKINSDLFLIPSESNFDEVKVTENSTNLQDLEEEKIKVEEVPLIVLNGKIFEIPKDAKDINLKRMHEEQLTTLLNVNVEDIESIAVLQKEAATAKWGNKGSNGVIEIKTKEAKDANKEAVSDKYVPEAKADSIYDVTKVRAQYPGGDEACYGFLARNVRYPKLCQEFGVQGRVIVSFVVEKDGSISNIKNVRCPSETLSETVVKSYKEEHPDSVEHPINGQDIGRLLYEEAERVVKLMPKWEPAKDEEGNPVRCRFNLPVMFRLSARQEGNGHQ